MFFAINTKDNKLVRATAFTSKENKYICPLCNTEVIVKQGEKNTPHFSHLNIIECEYSRYYKEKKQSIIHKKMIENMYNFFKSYNYVIDIKREQFIIKDSICDMLIRLKNDIEFVVICQHKEIDEKKYKNITYEYNKKGYAVLWVFSNRIKNNLLASCYITNKNEIYTIKKSNQKEIISSKDSIYLNQRIIRDDKKGIVIRIGIGNMKNKYKGIYIYDLDKENITKLLK